jgi:hypothetical protein
MEGPINGKRFEVRRNVSKNGVNTESTRFAPNCVRCLEGCKACKLKDTKSLITGLSGTGSTQTVDRIYCTSCLPGYLKLTYQADYSVLNQMIKYDLVCRKDCPASYIEQYCATAGCPDGRTEKAFWKNGDKDECSYDCPATHPKKLIFYSKRLCIKQLSDVKACRDGYVFSSIDPATHKPVCQKCHPSCLSCGGTTKSDCTTCKTGFFKFDDTIGAEKFGAEVAAEKKKFRCIQHCSEFSTALTALDLVAKQYLDKANVSRGFTCKKGCQNKKEIAVEYEYTSSSAATLSNSGILVTKKAFKCESKCPDGTFQDSSH